MVTLSDIFLENIQSDVSLSDFNVSTGSLTAYQISTGPLTFDGPIPIALSCSIHMFCRQI
jgi:hypothetical protein